MIFKELRPFKAASVVSQTSQTKLEVKWEKSLKSLFFSFDIFSPEEGRKKMIKKINHTNIG